MANNLPIIRNAILATRNSGSGVFLLTERFSIEQNDNVLFCIIESTEQKNATGLQKSIHDNLVKSFMSDPLFSSSNFEQSLRYINQKIEQILALNGSDIRPNALIGLVEKNLLHISMIGNVEGYLIRKGKINSVTEGLAQGEEYAFINISSGELLLGDQVIIANKNLFNRLSLDRIRRTLDQYTPKESIRDFYQILRKSRNLDCNALVFQAVNPLTLDKENENLSNFLYLDEIIESSYSKFMKKLKPVLVNLLSQTTIYLKFLFSQTKKLSQASQAYFQKHIAPQSQKTLSGAVSKAADGFSALAPKLSSNKDFKRSGLRIKPYSKKQSFNLTSFLNATASSVKWLISTKNRRYLYIALILLLISVSYFKINSNNQNREQIKKQNDAVYAYDQATQTFNSATEDIALGKEGGIDKLKESLSQAERAAESNTTREKALSLIKNIQTKIDTLSKTSRYYDQSPIFSFKYDATVSVLAGTKIYAFSSDGKIYSTDYRDKDPKLVGSIDASFGVPVSATYSDSMGSVFVLTDKSKIWAFDEQSQSGEEVLLDTTKDWEQSVSVAAYSTNLYLLDTINGKIWRHSQSGEKFTSGKVYVSGKNTDAKDGICMAIDGAIFILKSNGSVVKFSHFIPDTSFIIQTIPSPSKTLEKASSIYTDADSQYIFILDQENNRVIKYAKDGLYTSQYVIDGITPNHMLVNSRVQKMWMVSGKDVYELDL